MNLFNLFSKPSIKKVIQREIDENERKLLEQQQAAAYHAHMVQYLGAHIQTLKQSMRSQNGG